MTSRPRQRNPRKNKSKSGRRNPNPNPNTRKQRANTKGKSKVSRSRKRLKKSNARAHKSNRNTVGAVRPRKQTRRKAQFQNQNQIRNPRRSLTEDTKSNCIYTMFETRQLAISKDREAFIRVTIRELTIYLIYLGVVCTLILSQTSQSTFQLTNTMRNLFVERTLYKGPCLSEKKTFKDSDSIEDFWDFANDAMLHGLYWKYLYNSDGNISDCEPYQNSFWNINDGRSSEAGRGRKSKNIPFPELANGIILENRYVGVPRLRQIRVKPDSCQVAPSFRHIIRKCYGAYSRNHEDRTSDWGTGKAHGSADTAWRYFSEEELDGTSYWGLLATYSGGGSYVKLPVAATPSKDSNDSNDKPYDPVDEALLLMKSLSQNHWITRATRAIFLDFTVYNPNVNLFCIVKLIWEFPATGGVLPSWSIRTVKFLHNMNHLEKYFFITCEVLFILFKIYYIIQECCEMHFLGFKKYFSDVWSWVDLSILGFSVSCVGIAVYRYIVVEGHLENLDLETREFVDFELAAYWQCQYDNFYAVLLFVTWVKIFKYIAFNTTMTQMSTTLMRCAGDVGGFLIMFSIVFASFGQLGYILFGSQVKEFSTFVDSVFTLLLFVLGEFDFLQIEIVNPLLAPIYFLAFIFFVYFVLLNMFLAIITDAFGEVKADLQTRQNMFEVADYFKRAFNNFRGCLCGKKNEKWDAYYTAKLAASDGQVTYEELRQNLLSHNFSEYEIQVYLESYNLDRNRSLNDEEIHLVLAQMESQRIIVSKLEEDGKRRPSLVTKSNTKLNGSSGDPVMISEEIDGIDTRVAAMEASITAMINKVDMMIHKLDGTY